MITSEEKEVLRKLANQENENPLNVFFVRSTEALEPPSFFHSLPIGLLFLYSDFLIFLTPNTVKPGTGLFWGDFYEKFKSELNPVTILEDFKEIFKQTFNLKPELKEALIQCIESPNSIFIKTEDIIYVDKGKKGLQGCYIKLITNDKAVIFCPAEEKENKKLLGLGALVSLKEIIVGDWKKDFVSRLSDIATENRRYKSNKSNITSWERIIPEKKGVTIEKLKEEAYRLQYAIITVKYNHEFHKYRLGFKGEDRIEIPPEEDARDLKIEVYSEGLFSLNAIKSLIKEEEIQKETSWKIKCEDGIDCSYDDFVFRCTIRH